jgi:hypothetical protein
MLRIPALILPDIRKDRRMKRFTALVAVFALCSCAPTQFLNRKYEPAKLEGKSILIYPLSAGQIKVMNPDDFQDDFEEVKAEPGAFFKEELLTNSTKYFDEKFKAVKVENAVDSSLESLDPENSEKLVEKIGKDYFAIRVPKAEYLEKHHLNPKFVLVMDQLIFSRDLSTYQQTTPGMAPVSANVGGTMVKTPGTAPISVTTTRKSLSLGMNYVIYDYEEKAVVGYGFAKGESTFNFAMTKSDWYASMDDAFSKIKKFSPF